MKLPTSYQTTEIVQPGEQSFYLPATPVASQRAGILRFATIATVRRDHLDAIFLGQSPVQGIGIIGFVADQPFGQFVKEASGQNSLHKPTLGRRSAFDSDGERKTITSGDSDDLGALAASGRADREAPFLALAKVASTNASSRFSFPRSCKCLASRRSASTSLPSRTHR
jgi:hypothetical protein